MSTDKLKVKELTHKLEEAIIQFLASENPTASEKLKRTTHNHAKKLSKKFSQTVAKIHKKAAKIAAKLASNGKADKVIVGSDKSQPKKKVSSKV